MKLAALGDSITLGYGDPMPEGGWRGWAALLADAVGADLHNLAKSGAQVRDVAESQLSRALDLRPDVATVVVGVNDTLRDTFDAARIARTLDHVVGVLRQRGATVLTARLPDPGKMFGLPGVLARPLGRRIQAVNAAADAVAAQHGTVHFNAADLPCIYDRRMWSVDRLHPSERGHRFLATSFFDLVAAQLDVPAERRPGLEPSHPEPTFAAKAWWMATRGTKWLLDRSTDLVPSLLRLALAEWRSSSAFSELRDGSSLALDDGSLGWDVWHDQTGARPTNSVRSPSSGTGACIRRVPSSSSSAILECSVQPASPRACHAGVRAPASAG